MKRKSNVFLMFILVFAFAFMIKTDAKADDMAVTARTQNTIGIRWSLDSYYSDYKVTRYKIYIRSYGESDFRLVNTMYTSNHSGNYLFTGLKAGERYSIKVTVDKVSPYGYQSNDGSVDILNDEVTLPGKVTGLKQERWWYFIKQVQAIWDRQNGATGYEYYLYNHKNKVVKHEKNTGTSPSFQCSVSNEIVYHGKVRAFATINGQIIYGPWSSTSYFFTQPQATKIKISKGKLSVSWKKVNGATSYTIYVSNKAKGTGFKKVATVSSKKTSCTIKKFAGKKFNAKKKYYVYVVTNKKTGKKTNTSGKLYYWDTKFNRYYF